MRDDRIAALQRSTTCLLGELAELRAEGAALRRELEEWVFDEAHSVDPRMVAARSRRLPPVRLVPREQLALAPTVFELDDPDLLEPDESEPCEESGTRAIYGDRASDTIPTCPIAIASAG